jgi:hypothetical protein
VTAVTPPSPCFVAGSGLGLCFVTMHLRHLSIGLAAALSWSAFALAATVYKWTDSNGVVHYSDQPEPGAERIITQSAPETPRATGPAGSRAPAPAAAAVRPSPGHDQPKSVLDYSAFSIETPMPEQNFTDTVVPVRLRLEPYLRAGQVLALYMDGKLVEDQPRNALQFTLTDVPRGAHSLVATVMDTDSGETRSTAGVTFYVQRPSVLSPLRRKK